MNKRLFAIVGPTASGKSELAVWLAKHCNGEIISADSRQVYKGMGLGTGKVAGAWKNGIFVYQGIPHYIIDIASPRGQFSIAKFLKLAGNAAGNIQKRGKIPIICGGTGHWIDALVFGQRLPEVPPNQTLRKQLSKFTTPELYKKLQQLDPERAKNIDRHNPRRLIRAIEIVAATGKPVPSLTQRSAIDALWIGLKPELGELEQKIRKRLKQRLRAGMIEEVRSLHDSGLSWKKLESFGLEYKFIAQYLQNKLAKPDMEQQLYTAIRQYAKRQLTWWKRNKDIRWFAERKSAQDFLRKELKS